MSSTNVIITSGSKNQIIHVPVVTSTTSRSATPIEIVTSSSGALTINRSHNYQNSSATHNSDHNSSNNYLGFCSTNTTPNRSPQSSSVNRSNGNNRDLLNSNEDNCEVKTLYFNKESNDSREQLLLPTDTYIKQEEIDEEEYEEYESLDEEELEGIANSKTQYKCSKCGKGFCYTGWLDRHKLSSPDCRNARAVKDNYPISPKQSNNSPKTRESGGKDKSRPSLEGRLNELLSCPNESCPFVTHWVQSLNKHVFSSCKFGKDNTPDISPAHSSSRKPLHVCHICSKGFEDTEQHIQHMKNAHQIKLFYQCSDCIVNFDDKVELELHIEEHHRLGRYSAKEKLMTTAISAKADNNPNNASQQFWLCDLCNKSYLSLRSYEIHRTSCEKAFESSINTSNSESKSVVQRAPNSMLRPGAQARADTQSASTNNSIKHFKREQIEAIHKNDFRCRLCKKHFDTSNRLCNHLSRRPLCREWYYKNLPIELKKNNSLHLMVKKSKRREFELNSFGTHLQSSPQKQSTDDSSTGSLNRYRKPTAAAQRKLAAKAGYPYERAVNSARCDKCRKVFVGKNPTVALTNHLRGSTCVPTKYNPLQKPQVVRSRTTFPLAASRAATNANHSKKWTQSKPLGENRFYCKLCPRIELKNRVSLGCHLTIYHGLPQVNVTTSEGDAFRCQTCQQAFSSKYFYNLHRQDCDLTSPYVGIVTDSENGIQKNEKSESKGITCGQCGKSGFTNANLANIHRKYQCVNRHLPNKAQPNLKRFANGSGRKGVPHEKKVPQAEMARLNDRAKSEPNLTMCQSCGRGPYNSYYYFMEHKKKYCMALKAQKGNNQLAPKLVDAVVVPNKAKKSMTVEDTHSSQINESFCLNPSIPRARKTMNFANVSSPQVSHDSSPQNEVNDMASEHEVVSVSEVTKCSVCGQEFDDVLQFIRHRLSHLTQDIMQNESIDALECELCGARVHHYQRIQQHLILHLQNVQILKKKNLIEVQKKTLEFKHSIDESDDEDEEGTDDPVLHCPYCKSEYKSRVELADHIKNTCPFRYQCHNCNNTYLAKESFLEHKEECTRNTAINKIASKAPTYKCRNCGLEFRIKQQLLWHEHACNKVYTADHSGRVEEVIERTLSCSVCGLVSDVYENKVKHESKCLKRYLAVIGNSTEEIKSDAEEPNPNPKPLSPMNFDLTSLTNSSETSEVPEELINNLKLEFGIQKEVKVVLTAFDEEIVRKLKNDLYCEREESVQYEALKESFLALVRRLTKNNELLEQMSRDSNAQVVLSRMLKYLGEEVIEHNGLNELNCFRQNLQTFLKLTIKDDCLVLAYRDAESVDEAIINVLNFECELNCP